MRAPLSSYYPPRAGRLRFFRSAWAEVRRWFYHTYGEGRFSEQLASLRWGRVWCLIVPGYAFIDAGWPRVGKALLAGWGIAFLGFLMWLGYAPANAGLAAMLSIHVTSIMNLLNRAAPGMGLVRRLVFSLAVLFIVGQGLYGGLMRWAVLPLELRGRIYVIHRVIGFASFNRHELAAYNMRRNDGVVVIRSGYVLGPVVACPGDVVTFTENGVTVNGSATERQQWMPRSGSVTIPQKTWLIWPELNTLNTANIPEEQIARTVMQVAMVPRNDIIGKPFRRWFWRNQTL